MLPDDFGQERPVEYGFDDKQNHKVTFSLEINSFIPSFDFEEDIYTKFVRRDYSDNGAIWANYRDPNGYLTCSNVGGTYYDEDGSVWECTDGQFIKTATGYEPTALDLPGVYEESTSLIRTRRRRPADNRIFTMGNSNTSNPGDTENDKSLLGENYKVTGRNLPFNE